MSIALITNKIIKHIFHLIKTKATVMITDFVLDMQLRFLPESSSSLSGQSPTVRLLAKVKYATASIASSSSTASCFCCNCHLE